MWVSGIFLLGLVAPTAAAPTEPDVGDTPAAAQGPSAAPPAATPAADDAGAPPTDAEAPPEAAPQPAASASQVPAASSSSPAAWLRDQKTRDDVRRGITELRPSPPLIGEGFHVFDPTYLTLGVNTQSLCEAAAWELEASVATISDSMFWAGVYGTAGIQVGRKPDGHQRPSEEESCFEQQAIHYERDRSRDPFGEAGAGFRMGGGVELGWRMLGLDIGYLRNTALANQDHGFRLRAGLALAEELFTGGMTRYGKECCSNRESVVPCECARTPVGVSLFFYYAREEYFDVHAPERWGQNSVGLSLKLAVGVGGGP